MHPEVINDDVAIPVRATYLNLYKWPESDAKFIKSVIADGGNGRSSGETMVVDDFTRRQLYLRSYTFSRDQKDYTHIKRLGRIKEKINKRSRGGGGRRTSGESVIRRWLACTNKSHVLE